LGLITIRVVGMKMDGCVMLLWYSNILDYRIFSVFEGEIKFGDFHRKETAVKYIFRRG
jgi:hypothetical protein